ncbi:MAG: hypothetical protein ACYCZM_13255 [Acidimicrobiales bacterium]
MSHVKGRAQNTPGRDVTGGPEWAKNGRMAIRWTSNPAAERTATPTHYLAGFARRQSTGF